MKAIIEEKAHEVVYVEYQNNIPHSAITKDENGGFCYWAFFIEQGDEKDLKVYECGGGPESDIQVPHYVDGFLARYWMDTKYKFDGIPTNAKQIKTPILLNTYRGNSRNPFTISDIALDETYCAVCNHYSEEYCEEHIYFDNNGNGRYKHNNEYL